MKTAILSEYIPVILILVFVLYPKYMATFLKSYLGRFVAVLFIVLYAYYDFLYGLILCLLFIVFEEVDWEHESMTPMVDADTTPENELKKPIETFIDLATSTFEPMTTNNSGTDFRQTYCKSTELYYKGIPVSQEMAQHVFPEITYEGEICNLCDPNCKYSVVLNKIKTEDNIVKPKRSNDHVGINILGNDIMHLPFIGVVSETFSNVR
jgi:hypothetical protein